MNNEPNGQMSLLEAGWMHSYWVVVASFRREKGILFFSSYCFSRRRQEKTPPPLSLLSLLSPPPLPLPPLLSPLLTKTRPIEKQTAAEKITQPHKSSPNFSTPFSCFPSHSKDCAFQNNEGEEHRIEWISEGKRLLWTKRGRGFGDGFRKLLFSPFPLGYGP